MKKKELRQRIKELESEVRFLRLANGRHRDRIRELERGKAYPDIKPWATKPWVSTWRWIP